MEKTKNTTNAGVESGAKEAQKKAQPVCTDTPVVTYFETCAGIGVTGIALKNVGRSLGIDFKPVGFSEIDKSAIAAYGKIHGEDMKNYGDVTKIDWNKVNCDFLSFTFPCQNISIANRNGKGFEEGAESSSSIIWSLRDTFKCYKPRFIFMENVAAILNCKNRPTLDKLVDFLEHEGYHVQYMKLDAADYGVAQHRERVYILATLGTCIDFPEPDKEQLKVKLCDILEKDPAKCRSYMISDTAKKGFIERGMRTDKQYPIRVFNPSHAQTSFTITTKSGSRNSDNFVFLEDLTEDEFVKVSPQGLKKAGVTIAQIEGREIRKLTPLETMRLMGLEEGHIKLLDGFTPNQIYKLMGNSIVVPVLEKVLYNYFKTLMDEGYL